MKTLKFKILFVTVLLYSITLGSCNMQDYDIQIPERVFGKLDILQNDLTVEVKDGNILSFEYQVTDAKDQIKLETKIDNKRFLSVLSYKYEESGWADISVFDIDLQEVVEKKNMNIIVEKHAKTLKKKFDVSIVGRIADILEGVPELLYNELGKKEYTNESTLSIFYHLAAFSTARRSYESRSRDCQCDVNPNYINGSSPFFCAEDIMISADWAYDFISEKTLVNKIADKQFNPKSTLKYLSSESGRLVSASKINKLLREELVSFLKNFSEKERQQLTNKKSTLSMVPMMTTRSEEVSWWEWLTYDLTCLIWGVTYGSDCGCCGNYSGLCHYCDVICYLHDHDCVTCEPRWYCLDGCVPGPC